MARYSIGPFPAQVIFRPSQGPLILGLICSIRLHTTITVIFCLWAKFSPSLQSARLRTINTLGHFHVKKTVGLFPVRYQIRPINGLLWSMNSTTHDWQNDDTPCRRPMDPTARMRPMDRTARRRPMDRTAHRRPMDPTARRRPMNPKACIEGQWILWSV